MQQINLKYIINIKDLVIKRDSEGVLTHIGFYGKSLILRPKFVALKWFSEDAKEFIFSKYPKQLSSLEKELL